MGSAVVAALLFAGPLGVAGQTYAMPWWHPRLQSIAVNRIAAPANHPNVEGLFRSTFRAHGVWDEHDGELDGRWVSSGAVGGMGGAG